MKTPKNRKQQALWYLINFNKFTLSDVIKHSHFYKFQSRLGELEADYGLLAMRTNKKVNTIFGKATVTEYEAIDKEKCKLIYDKL